MAEETTQQDTENLDQDINPIVVGAIEPTPSEEEQPPSATNLVEYFTDDELKALSRKCVDDFDVDVRSRESHMKLLNEWQKLYSSALKAKSRPFTNCANVNVPLLSYAVLQIHARMVDMLVPGSGNWYASIPTGSEDVERANAVEKFVNHYFKREMPDYSQQTVDMCWQYVMNGSVVVRTVWDSLQGRLVVETVPIENFVAPYNEKCLDPYMRKLSRYTYIDHFTLYELHAYAAGGVLKNVEKLKLSEANVNLEQSILRGTVDQSAGQENNLSEGSPEDIPRKILEQHRKIKLPKKTKKAPYVFDGKVHPVAITIDSESEQIMRIVVREEDDPRDKKRYEKELALYAVNLQAGLPATEPKLLKRREFSNFVHCRAFPSEGFYGLGIGSFVGPINQANNSIVNALIDACAIQVAPPAFVSRQLNMKRGDLNTAPGAFTEVNASPALIRDGLVWVQPPPIDAAYFNISGKMETMANRVSGTGEILSGEPAGDRETATTTKIRLEEARAQISILAKQLLEYVKFTMRNVSRIFAAFLPDEDVVSVLTPEGNFEEVKYSKSMFEIDADIVPTANPRAGSRTQRVDEAMNLAAYVAQNPVTAQNPVIQMGATIKVLNALDEPQLAGVVRQQMQQMLAQQQQQQQQGPPPPRPQFQENAGFLMEQDSPVHPNDNDDEHLDELGLFAKDPYGLELMSPAGKQAYERHARAHASQKLLKERALDEQRKAAAAAGGIPGPFPGRPGPMA